MKRMLSLVIALVVSCVPALASAQWAGHDLGWDPPHPALGPPRRPALGGPDQPRALDRGEYHGPWKLENRWYRWQTLGVDVAGVVTGISANSLDVILGSYALGGPLVHVLHGRPEIALGSLGVRVLFPLIGKEIGRGDQVDDGDDRGLSWGFFGGMLAASLMDAVWFANEDHKVPDRPPEAASAPLLEVTQHGAKAGWQGTF